MARVMNQMPLHDITYDCSGNPEIILMAAEGDEAEGEVSDSLWHSGTAVTKPKHSNYDKD